MAERPWATGRPLATVLVTTPDATAADDATVSTAAKDADDDADSDASGVCVLASAAHPDEAASTAALCSVLLIPAAAPPDISAPTLHADLNSL